MKQRCVRTFLWFISCVLGLALVDLPDARANEEECAGYLRQKLYSKAADCFAKEAAKMPPVAKLSKLEKKRKGFYLRTIAESYLQQGELAAEPKERAYIFEKGVRIAAQSVKEKLCLKDYDCQSSRGLLQELREKVGYSRLTIVNSRPEPARIEIFGYQYSFQESITSVWTGEIRPGEYNLKVTFATGPSQEIPLTIGRNETRTFNLPPKPPIPTGVWVAGGIGLGLVGVGIGILVPGILSEAALQAQKAKVKTTYDSASSTVNGRKTDCEKNPPPNPPPGEGNRCVTDMQNIGAELGTVYTNYEASVKEQEKGAEALKVGGGIAIAVGAGLLLGAVIWLLLPRKEAVFKEEENLRNTNQDVLGKAPFPPLYGRFMPPSPLRGGQTLLVAE